MFAQRLETPGSTMWARCKEECAIGKQLDVTKPPEELAMRSDAIWKECVDTSASQGSQQTSCDISDEHILKRATFTDRIPLGWFEGAFELVPTLVNVVTLCEVLPHPNSVGGDKLPLNLQFIASRCSNAYYAPRRFAAVQLAFSNPRSRVLIFRARPYSNYPVRPV